jgi:hypothetical protein
MMRSKPKTKSFERYTFTNEEIQRLKTQNEQQIIRTEIIGLLDGYSASFAQWSIIISKAVHESMAKKQQSNTDCEKESEMLDNLSFLFTRLAYSSGLLSDWHKQLMLGNELMAKMIEEGHP